ncbi:hypothetical protein [Pseudonocardia sp.]|uniref:hypothetical protein n=1 Tax=Pseudonocardia sp. TaxID=60912 RepID=UPI003D0B8058
MSAVDELVDLVENAAAAERAVLASKWKDRDHVAATIRGVEQRIAERRDLERRSAVTPAAEPALVGAPVAVEPDDDRTHQEAPGDGRGVLPAGDDASPVGTHAEAARAERAAEAAVRTARAALQEAHLAVLKARLARIDAGEAEPDASVVDGHTALAGRNAVTRHGPALARGLRGEIHYVLTRKPRSVLKNLAISLALGLLYLGFIRTFEWDTKQRLLPYLGLWAISVVMGGAVCLNAMSFDAMRVRAALDSGARLWHVLVIKNLALLTLVAPLGFLLSALLAWRAGDLGAFFKACALMLCFILLWLGVGNVLSIALPIRDEPVLKRRKDGTLKQFLIVFGVSYAVGYLVNLMLIWRVFAAQELTARLGNVVIPAILVVLSSLTMWFLLTVFALALAQQPKIRRAMMREIADYGSNAEAQAYAAEAAKASPADPTEPATTQHRQQV